MAAPILPEKVSLASEEEAWELLRSLVEGRAVAEKLPELVLGDWAEIDVYIPAEKYDSSLTPYMMKGWVDFQLSVYRSYSLARGGEAEARTLTDAEKERLELIVEVRSGSSDQSVNIQKILETTASSMVDKMEPTQILIVLMTLMAATGTIRPPWRSLR